MKNGHGELRSVGLGPIFTRLMGASSVSSLGNPAKASKRLGMRHIDRCYLLRRCGGDDDTRWMVLISSRAGHLPASRERSRASQSVSSVAQLGSDCKMAARASRMYVMDGDELHEERLNGLTNDQIGWSARSRLGELRNPQAVAKRWPVDQHGANVPLGLREALRDRGFPVSCL